MNDEKVVSFPGTVSAMFPPRQQESDTQSGLFGRDGDQRGKIVFLDIGWLAEETLLILITRNSVTGLVDLRPRPVFDRPLFRHSDVVRYLYERDIIYVEYALLAKSYGKSESLFRHGLDNAGEEKINVLLGRGLTICLYDDAARSAGWLGDVRHLFRHAPSFQAEMHPRALAAAPTGASSSRPSLSER